MRVLKMRTWLTAVMIVLVVGMIGAAVYWPKLSRGFQSESEALEGVWYRGSVDQAFAEARKQHKPIFLYWGAVWCPPCNELKSQVFGHPEFKDLVANVIPVYLDGDTQSAQEWGEKLAISGYPTVLLLSSTGKELWRVSTGLNFEEFKQGLLAAFQVRQPIKEVIQQVLQGNATPEDWTVLANTAWGQMPKETFGGEPASILWQLFQTAPIESQKAALASAYLEWQSLQGQEFIAPDVYTEPLEYILANRLRILAGRQFIIWYAKEFFDKTLGSVSDQWRQQLAERWIAASNVIYESTDSIEGKVDSFFPAVELYKLGLNHDPNLKGDIASLPDLIARSQSVFVRKGTVTTIAYMLRETGQLDAASNFLIAEVKSSTTPWYEWSALSKIEEKRGDMTKALEYAHLAAQAATGRATSVQWLASEIELKSSMTKNGNKDEDLREMMANFYHKIFQLDDGFQGRNLRMADKVAIKLKKHVRGDPSLGTIIKTASSNCARIGSKTVQENCKDHFLLY